MKRFALIAVLVALFITSTVYAAPSLTVSPNPVSQGQSYVISGCGYKRTEFATFIITAPSGNTKLVYGWLANDGCIYTDASLSPLIISGFSSELGQYRVDMRMVFVGPKGIVSTAYFLVQ